MANCPVCKGDMPTMAIERPHCGYDFPAVNLDEPRAGTGFAYSPLADLALIVRTIVSALGVVFSILGAVVLLLNGQFFAALVIWPFVFLMQVGMLVVFLRVQQR